MRRSSPFPATRSKSDPDVEKFQETERNSAESWWSSQHTEWAGLSSNQPTPLLLQVPFKCSGRNTFHGSTPVYMTLFKTGLSSTSVSKQNAVASYAKSSMLPFNHWHHLVVSLVPHNVIDEIQLPAGPAQKYQAK